MQIKRFEAADMTEALRMVKRELGEDAVILSAKEIRPGGFFSALRKKSVEISAATDYPAEEAESGDDFAGMLSRNLEDETDRVSLSSPGPDVTPIFPTASSSGQRPPVSSLHELRSAQSDAVRKADTIAEPASPAAGSATCRSGKDASVPHWSQYITRQNLTAEPFYSDLERSKTIAVVGPHGAGKSTTLAKLAWHCHTVEKKRTGLISLDRFHIGANAMLERVAQIMNLPFTIVHDEAQLRTTLIDLADVDVVLIDTPGIGRTDRSKIDEIAEMIQLARPDEIHLVANATVRGEVFNATAEAFSHFGVDRLLLTHMDEYIESPSFLKLLKNARLPVSFYAEGVDLFEGLKEAPKVQSFNLSRNLKSPGRQVAAFSGKRMQGGAGLDNGGHCRDSCQYVANRNSELFHHYNCKSVKRINAENITAFNSIEEALDEGFKPCRACCDTSMLRKSVPAAFGYKRASAI